MNLYIIRHAWAEQRNMGRWPADSKRPLTQEGAERFRTLLGALRRHEFEISVLAASPYVRCVQTARLASEAFTPPVAVEELESLEPGSDLGALADWTNARISEGHENIAWVGHAPDVDHLAASLIGDGRAFIRFAKGAVALIRFDDQVIPGDGELRWLVTGKVLGV